MLSMCEMVYSLEYLVSGLGGNLENAEREKFSTFLHPSHVS